MPAPQGILDPEDHAGYVPMNQAQFDEMKAALEGAPDATQKFIVACAFKEAGYDSKDLLAVGAVTGLNVNTDPASLPYAVGSKLGDNLGAPWKQAVTDAAATVDPVTGAPTHGVGTANPPNPSGAGGMARKLGLKS